MLRQALRVLVASAPSSSALGTLTSRSRLHANTASSWLFHRSFAASTGDDDDKEKEAGTPSVAEGTPSVEASERSRNPSTAHALPKQPIEIETKLNYVRRTGSMAGYDQKMAAVFRKDLVEFGGSDGDEFKTDDELDDDMSDMSEGEMEEMLEEAEAELKEENEEANRPYTSTRKFWKDDHDASSEEEGEEGVVKERSGSDDDIHSEDEEGYGSDDPWDVNHSDTVAYMQRRMLSQANKVDHVTDLFRAPPEWDADEPMTIEGLLASIKPYLVAPSLEALRHTPSRILQHLSDVPPAPPSALEREQQAQLQAAAPRQHNIGCSNEPWLVEAAGSSAEAAGEDRRGHQELAAPCPVLEQPAGMEVEEYEELMHEIRMEYGIELLSEYNINQLHQMRPALSLDEELDVWAVIGDAAEHRSAARLNDELMCLLAGVGKPFSEQAWHNMVPELVAMWKTWEAQMAKINKRKGKTGKAPAADAKTLSAEAAAIKAATNDDMMAFVDLACKTIMDNPSLSFQQKMHMMQVVGKRDTGPIHGERRKDGK